MNDREHLIRQLIHENRLDEAKAQCRQLCQLEPNNARTWFNLGNINARNGALDEATENFQQVLRILPQNAGAYFNLGRIATLQNQADQAVKYYRKVLQLEPDYIEAYNNLGNLLRISGQPDSALDIFNNAIRVAPESFAGLYKIHDSIASTLQEKGDYQAALDHYRKALDLKPDYAEAHSNLLFLLSYNVLCTPQQMLEESQQWGRIHGGSDKTQTFSHPTTGDPHKRLRIGYVSPDLRHHAVSYFFEPILAHHDPQKVEVFCYAEVKHPDAVTQRLQTLAQHWRSTVGVNDEAVARMIHDDHIDILIDLAGHTANSRIKVFTYKPAPVQATYLGYFTTTGLAAMDYWITDNVLHPENTVELASETLYRLPRCCLAYKPEPETPGIAPRNSDTIIFGSFNQLTKISSDTLSLWAELLKALPDSQLLLKCRQLTDKSVQARLRKQFRQLGIATGRLTLLPHIPSLQEHLATYGQVDIVLDTIPRTGGSTTTEALWMGIPVITLAGERFIERLSASMLTAVGLKDCIASSTQDYIQKAVALANNPQLRQQLRHTLRQRMAQSPLCDGKGLARTLENAYQIMWQNFINNAQDRNLMMADEPALSELLQSAIQHHHAGRLEQAKILCNNILEQHPDHPDTLNLLGVLALHWKQYETAIQMIRKAISVNAGNPAYFYNLGLVFQETDRFDDASAAFQQALKLKPEYPEAYYDLGNTYTHQGKLDAAIKCYHQAIHLRSDFVDAYFNLGIAQHNRGLLTAAITNYEQALQYQPDDAEIRNNLGNALKDQGYYETARKQYSMALKINPGFIEARSNLLFLLSYNVLCTPQQMLEESCKWDRIHGGEDKTLTFSHPRTGDPNQRLRIGYVSPDLYRHAVSYFFEPILANHDHQKVEVFCYAEVHHPDDVTLRLQKLAQHWRSTVGLSDEATAQLIHDDRIDILIDLAGHTASNRLGVFTYKPAPVQATYLGYFATTGLETMDYWITDTILHPENTKELATENLYRLPRCCLTYQPEPDTPPVAQRPQDGIVFGSFNQLTKTTPQAIQLWAEILSAIPEARMLIKTRQLADPALRATLQECFTDHGITTDRLILLPHTTSHREHLATYGQIDIALDTIPRTGGSTTAEALWMGVPVITLAGERYIERLSTSMLSAVELPDCIASSTQDYNQKAVALANNPELRQQLRHTLRQRMLQSPLCHSKDLAQTLEMAYQNMWRHFLADTNTSGQGTGDHHVGK